MKILFLQSNDTAEAIASTSLLKRLINDGHKIHCITDEISANVFRFCKGCHVDVILSRIEPKYDAIINLSLDEKCSNILQNVKTNAKYGFIKKNGFIDFYNKGADVYSKAKHIGIPTEANIFQLLFGVMNLTWKGEGYSFNYFPRNRMKKVDGIAVRNTMLRNYLSANLRGKFKTVQIKQNMLRQSDEINRCQQIVTDDETIMHLALALHKNVEYVIKRKPPYKIEMFGSGNIHSVDIRKLMEMEAFGYV